jgi:hypothetical protein
MLTLLLGLVGPLRSDCAITISSRKFCSARDGAWGDASRPGLPGLAACPSAVDISQHRRRWHPGTSWTRRAALAVSRPERGGLGRLACGPPGPHRPTPVCHPGPHALNATPRPPPSMWAGDNGQTHGARVSRHERSRGLGRRARPQTTLADHGPLNGHDRVWVGVGGPGVPHPSGTSGASGEWIKRGARNPQRVQVYFRRLVLSMVMLLTSDLTAPERCQAGEVLGQFGDPRFARRLT